MKTIIFGLIIMVLCVSNIHFINQTGRILDAAEKDLKFKDEQMETCIEVIKDLKDPDQYHHHEDNCTIWEEKQMTKSIHDVNGIECPEIIQESYENDNDYKCKVCTNWTKK